MSFSRCLDIWGLIGEMRSDHRPGLPTQSTRYISGVLISFLVGMGKRLSTAKLPLNCML